MTTLSRMRTSGAAVLAAHLADTDAGVRNGAAQVLSGQGEIGVHILGKCLKHPNPHIRANASRSLAWMGASGGHLASASRACIPDLLKLVVEDGSCGGAVRKNAANAIANMGPIGAEGLARLFADDNPDIRKVVKEELLNMGDDAVGILTSLLYDASPSIRRHALAFLVSFGSAGAAALAVILDTSKDASARRRAAEGLGQVGPELAAPHVAALAARLEDQNHWVQIAAARSLGQLGTATGSDVAAASLIAPLAVRLGGQLKAEKKLVRHSVAKVLGRAGAKVTCPHVQDLAAGLGDQDPIERMKTAQALREMSGVGSAAAEAWLKNNDEVARMRSRAPLCRTGLVGSEFLKEVSEVK
jgi:HEAT repeat protein